MTLVRIKTNFRSRYWNIGDTVEMEGEQLKRELANGNVEIMDKTNDLQRCGECGFVAASAFGLQAHQKKHKGGWV